MTDFRESKNDVDSDSDSSIDSYESISLHGSEQGDISGDILQVVSDTEEGEIVADRPKRNSVWSDVVTEQVLTSSLGQLNQKPIVFEKFPRKEMTQKSRKRKKVNKTDLRSSIPAKLQNYHDFDAENGTSSLADPVNRPPSASSSNRVDFNALVKAVEKGRFEERKPPASKPRLKKPATRRLGPITRSSSSQQKASGGNKKRSSSDFSHAEIDPGVKVDESMGKEQLVDALSCALNEKQSLDTISNAVDVLGPERCVDFFRKTVAKEKNGGITIMDGSRRKTPGGVFFYLIKTSADVTPDQRTGIFGTNSELKAKKKRRNHGKKHPKTGSRTLSSTNSLDNDDEESVEMETTN